jgi:Ser/Thr protein kinase RdoA (MazF antagonist)
MGPAVQDLWMMLSGDRQQQLLQLDTMLSGYDEFYSFETNQLPLIESLRTMRVVNYMAWLCKRWQDPAFPHNFPWFNTEKYWEQQILILKEQMSALQQPPLSLLP